MKSLPRILVAASLSACLIVGGVTVSAATGSSSLPPAVLAELEMAEGVSSQQQTVARGAFAQTLLSVSKQYHNGLGTAAAYQLFSDVPSTRDDAAAIAAAVQNGWMSGFLGGVFRPDEPVTVREAADAALALLGYTASDFGENETQGRRAAYASTGLLDGISADLGDPLTGAGLQRMFYNLLKAETPQGAMYGTSFGCTLDEDGEIDLEALQDEEDETGENSIRGPVLVEETLEDAVPFSLSKATVLIDGVVVDSETASGRVSEGSAAYYSSRTRTVWVYQDNVATGTVTGVAYDLSGSLTPTAVYVDGTEYLVTTEEMKEELEGGRAVRVGDEVTLLYDESTSDEGGSLTLRDIMVE